jgi:uncharacterized protein with ParB-like and HNH nuclease domain
MMVEDLATTFLKSYKPEHRRSDVVNYQSYYLGPVVFSVNAEDGRKSIIDGQQRITSITLMLIYLNHLQSERDNKVSIAELIFLKNMVINHLICRKSSILEATAALTGCDLYRATIDRTDGA